MGRDPDDGGGRRRGRGGEDGSERGGVGSRRVSRRNAPGTKGGASNAPLRDEDRDGVDFEKKPKRVFTGSARVFSSGVGRGNARPVGRGAFLSAPRAIRGADGIRRRRRRQFLHAPSPCVSRSAGSATAARTAGSRPRCGTRPSCWPSTSSGTKKNSEAFARSSRLRRARRRRRVARRRHGPPGESPAVTREPPRQLRRGEAEGHAWDVRPLAWGPDAATALGGEKFDLVVATDCMYVEETAGALVDTLASLVGDVGVEGGAPRGILPGGGALRVRKKQTGRRRSERSAPRPRQGRT